MHFGVIPVFAKLFADIFFIYVVVNTNSHIHQVLTDDAENKYNG